MAQAQYWAWQARLPSSAWRYVVAPYVVRGVHRQPYTLVGTYDERRDLPEILAEMDISDSYPVSLFDWASTYHNTEAYLSPRMEP